MTFPSRSNIAPRTEHPLTDSQSRSKLGSKPTEHARETTIGFSISPSQTLMGNQSENLQRDLISLLSSLTYHPPHVSKVALDLRYVIAADDSLARKHLDIVLLVCIHLDPDDPPRDPEEITMRFREDLYNLLSLNLNPYEMRVGLLPSAEVEHFMRPFKVIKDIVEITRRVTQYAPFDVNTLEGSSPMTKIVDMLLRERGQCCYSVLLEPHRLSKEEQDGMAAYGYSGKMLPPKMDKEIAAALSQALKLEPGAMGEPMFASFRMKIRLFSDVEISQYVVNLVGAEISGHGDFMPLQRLKPVDFEEEVASLSTLDFNPLLSKVVQLNVPSQLLDLVYLFRPKEAVSAFRFPTERISVSKEKMYKTYYAPVTNLPKEGLLIGTSEHPSHKDRVDVRLRDPDRKRHMYVVGKTGTGKSMMLLTMIAQDLAQNKGLCLIDPHGDLVDAALAHIPENRKDDVFIFDPSDQDYVVGLNFLETTSGSEAEKDYVVQEIISILLRTVDYDLQMYGPRAQQWTRYGCMTMMALPEDTNLGGTLLEVPRLFSDGYFLRAVMEQIKDEVLLQYWRDEYLNMADFHKSEMMGYFTSKFTPLVTGPQVRNIIGQKKSGFNFKKIMDERKILLVNLASGKIGRRNSELLGSMFVSRFLWTAMGRAWQTQESRHDFYLYVDEFQNFITDSFETILSEARKYGLNLIIAHQHLAQLRAMGRMGDKLERAVFGNVGTMAAFRTGPDAVTIASEFGDPAEHSTLRNLENRYAVVKLLVKEVPTVPFTMKTVDYATPRSQDTERGKRIRQESLRQHGRPIKEVDQEIRNRYGGRIS